MAEIAKFGAERKQAATATNFDWSAKVRCFCCLCCGLGRRKVRRPEKSSLNASGPFSRSLAEGQAQKFARKSCPPPNTLVQVVFVIDYCERRVSSARNAGGNRTCARAGLALKSTLRAPTCEQANERLLFFFLGRLSSSAIVVAACCWPDDFSHSPSCLLLARSSLVALEHAIEWADKGHWCFLPRSFANANVTTAATANRSPNWPNWQLINFCANRARLTGCRAGPGRQRARPTRASDFLQSCKSGNWPPSDGDRRLATGDKEQHRECARRS